MEGTGGLVGTSLEALGRQYRSVAHNLANANTVAFKKRKSVFAQVLAEQQRLGTAEVDPQTVVQETPMTDFAQGALVGTGRTLDVALSSKGFFVVDSPDGPLYTRKGQFHTNPQGQLVDSVERLVQGQGGPITISGGKADQVRISADGVVSVAGQNLGKLRVVQFDNESLLAPLGNSSFHAGEAVPSDAEQYAVRQGFCEASNVSVVEEMVDLITVTRLYEANLKSIVAEDDRLKQILGVATA